MKPDSVSPATCYFSKLFWLFSVLCIFIEILGTGLSVSIKSPAGIMYFWRNNLLVCFILFKHVLCMMVLCHLLLWSLRQIWYLFFCSGLVSYFSVLILLGFFSLCWKCLNFLIHYTWTTCFSKTWSYRMFFNPGGFLFLFNFNYPDDYYFCLVSSDFFFKNFHYLNLGP